MIRCLIALVSRVTHSQPRRGKLPSVIWGFVKRRCPNRKLAGSGEQWEGTPQLLHRAQEQNRKTVGRRDLFGNTMKPLQVGHKRGFA